MPDDVAPTLPHEGTPDVPATRNDGLTPALHGPDDCASVGRYRILGEIGRGGMGAVLRGHDPDLGRDLALKVLLADSAERPEVVQRFREEAQIGGQLQHPGVVPVYELGRFDDGRPFFTMKLVKGMTFAQLLRERSGPDQERPRFLKIFEQICQAVAFAHSRRVIHRDLKPSNVMVGAFGEVQVMDWGLAKLLDQGGEQKPERTDVPSVVHVSRTDSGSAATQEGDVMGTPAYMPPEQALGEINRLDERCDVFSLGAILCELLTGSPPYTGTNSLRQARRADLTEALGRLENCSADVELTALARRCLSPEPGDRPRDAGVVAVAVVAYLVGVEERARQAELERAAAVVRAAGERRAKRLTLGLAAAVLLLVVAGGVGTRLVQQQRAEAEARRARLDDRAGQILAQARTQQQEAWENVRETELTESLALARRALDEDVGDDVRTEAETLIALIEERIARTEKNSRLLLALLEVSQPSEWEGYRTSGSGQVMELVETPAEEQYVAAFLAWGVDVDSDPVEVVARRFSEQPRPVIEQVTAGLERWSRDRQSRKQPEPRWRKLLTVADELDPDAGRRELRQLRATGRLKQERDRLLKRVQTLDPARESVLGVLTLADTLIEAGEAGVADQLLRAALTARPGDIVLLNRRGRLLEQQPQRLREAAELYRAARARDPRLGLNLARALVQTLRAEEAEAILRQLGADREDHPELMVNLGVVLAAQNKTAEAATVLGKAVEHHPGFARAYVALAMVLRMQKKLAEAEALCRKLVALQPDFAVGRLALGLILHSREQLGEAEASYRKAVALQPDEPVIHIGYAYLLLDQKKLTEAEAACRKAMKLQPGLAPAQYCLGKVMVARGKPVEAVAAYRKAVSLDPASTPSYIALAETLVEQKEPAEAATAYRRAAELQPDDGSTYNRLGDVLRTLQKPVEAEASYRKALELQPDSPEVYCGLGLALTDQKRLKDAEAAFRKAIDRDRDFGPAYYGLGVVLREQNRLTEAATALRKTAQLLPNNLSVRNDLRRTERLVKLDQRLADVLSGKAKPDTAMEWIELAQHSSTVKEPPLVTLRFYTEAFRADPKSADDLEAEHRYNAACAAALASVGKLDETERRRVRGQALEYLRADLTAYTEYVGKLTVLHTLIRERLAHWRQDADLSGVRDEKSLAALPEKERIAWRQLWADVAALSKKVEGKE